MACSPPEGGAGDPGDSGDPQLARDHNQVEGRDDGDPPRFVCIEYIEPPDAVVRLSTQAALNASGAHEQPLGGERHLAVR